jgi:predicted unusual protein kinase regulating ubiquinone biosynthesis (AarF/ABC1/UbiB family)
VGPDPHVPPALASLADAVRAFAAQAPSARVNVARLEGVVRPGLVPAGLRESVRARLEAAFAASAHPLPGREVERLLRDAWGESPARVLDDLDLDEPLAVRPHAQTHRAERDGEPVAVKVVRPRVVAALRTDLAVLDLLAGPAAGAFPALDARPLLAEVRERLMDELDLEHEGEVHRRVARGLRRVDGVEVARVDAELTTHGVHVSALLDGPTLADGDARPDDPGAVARTLVRVFLGAPLAIGVALANPRPNDVVLLPGGGVGLIGPGSARAVPRERVDAWVATLEAIRARDADAFAAALGAQGVLPPDAGHMAYAHAEHALGPLLWNGPAMLDDAALAAAGARALDRVEPIVAVAGRATPDPADLWPLRMLAQLAALLATLRAEEDWVELALGALRDGWR